MQHDPSIRPAEGQLISKEENPDTVLSEYVSTERFAAYAVGLPWAK